MSFHTDHYNQSSWKNDSSFILYEVITFLDMRFTVKFGCKLSSVLLGNQTIVYTRPKYIYICVKNTWFLRKNFYNYWHKTYKMKWVYGIHGSLPGWKTSYLNFVTTSDTKLESALAKNGTDATNDRSTIVINNIFAKFLGEFSKDAFFVEKFALVAMLEIFRYPLTHLARKFTICHVFFHLFYLLW